MNAQFSIAATDLIAAMAWLDKAAPMPKRRTIPVLNCCIIRAGSDGRAMIEGYDCDNRPRVDVAADVITAGSVVVDRAQLLALAKRAKDSKADCVEIGAPDLGKVRLGFGGACYDFATRPVADWPVETDREFRQAASAPLLTIDYPAADLAEDLALLSPAVSTEETRYYLNGICFDVVDGALTLAATDGHKLAVIRRGVNVAAGDMAPIVPRVPIAAMAYLAKAGGSIRIEIGHNGGRVISGAYSVAFKLIDGSFPDWRRVERSVDPLAPSLYIMAAELSGHIATAAKKGRCYPLIIETAPDSIRAGQAGEGAHARPMVADYDGAAVRIGLDAAYLAPYAKLGDSLIIQADEMATGAEYVNSPMAVKDPARPHFSFTLMPLREPAALPAAASIIYPDIKAAPGQAADLFNVERFDGTSDKPRKATDDECKAYLLDYARRCGLAELSDCDIIYTIGGAGDDAARPIALLIGGTDNRVKDYADGAYCVPMPGRNQAPVTVQMIRDDGTLSDPMLCTDAKGKIALPDQPKEKRRRKTVSVKPALPAETVSATPDPAAVALPVDAEKAVPANTPPLEEIEPIAADQRDDELASLAARVAALEEKLAAMDSGQTDTPPLAEIEPLPIAWSGARARLETTDQAKARPSRESRLRAVQIYLALRAKRAALADVMAENAALLVRLAETEKASISAVAKRKRTIGAAWRRYKASQVNARGLADQIRSLSEYRDRAGAQFEKAQTETATARRLLDKARTDLVAVTRERDRQAVAIGAITARIDRIEQGQERVAA